MAGCRSFSCNAVGFGLVRADVVAGAVGGFVWAGAELFRFSRNVGDKIISRH